MYFLVNASQEVTAIDCGGVEVLNVIKFIFKLLEIVLFTVPMILIVMLMVDLGKAVASSKEDEMKKNRSIAIRRVTMCIALFLVGALVHGAMLLLPASERIDYDKCIKEATGKNSEDYFGETKEITN